VSLYGSRAAERDPRSIPTCHQVTGAVRFAPMVDEEPGGKEEGFADGVLIARRVLETPGADVLMEEANAVVFAWYGQAVVLASALEAALVAYLSAAPPATKARRRQPDRHAYFLENLSRKALGELRDELGRFPQLREAVEDVTELNELRIALVHHWFLDPTRRAKLAHADGARS